MASAAPSDSESNVSSSFIRFSDKNLKDAYCSIIEGMELINQDVLQIERNLKHIVEKAGPMESQLSVLLQTLPKPNVPVQMETD